jgi:hypothetical protein
MISADNVKKGDWIKHYREGELVISEVLETDNDIANGGLTIFTTNGALAGRWLKVFERRPKHEEDNPGNT